MVTRVHIKDPSAARALAEALDARGDEVALVTERIGGGDEVIYLVATTADSTDVAPLLPPDAEVSSD